MKRALWVFLVSLAAAACAETVGTPASTRTPGEFTLEEFVSTSSLVDGAVPDWSPDGTTILFLGRDTLWTVAADGGDPQAIPAEGVTNPAYSPDGEWIGYVSSVSGDGQELWLRSLSEQRAVQLTDLGARTLAWSWSPDGRHIAFSNSLRGNYDIYTVSVPGGQVKRLTTDTRYDVQPTWTPDGSGIVFVRMDQWWIHHDVIAIDAATGAGERVIVSDRDWMDYRTGQEFGPGQVSPRGDLVLFRSYRSGWINWWLAPMEGGEPRPLAPEAADQSSQKPFRGYARWSPDGARVAYTSNLKGRQILRVASVDDGAVRTLFAPEMGLVANPAWSPDGSRIAFTFDTPAQVPDLFVMDAAGGEPTRLTRSLPDPALADAFFLPERVSYENDGLTIHSYLFRPPGAPPPGGYPAIVWVHGGPSSQFEDGWRRHADAHYFIKHGYAVLAPNIRGSSGFGWEHEEANNGCWARCDLDDVVAGARYLGTLPDINGDRVAVTGVSYGAYLSFAAEHLRPGRVPGRRAPAGGIRQPHSAGGERVGAGQHQHVSVRAWPAGGEPRDLPAGVPHAFRAGCGAAHAHHRRRGRRADARVRHRGRPLLQAGHLRAVRGRCGPRRAARVDAEDAGLPGSTREGGRGSLAVVAATADRPETRGAPAGESR